MLATQLVTDRKKKKVERKDRISAAASRRLSAFPASSELAEKDEKPNWMIYVRAKECQNFKESPQILCFPFRHFLAWFGCCAKRQNLEIFLIFFVF